VIFGSISYLNLLPFQLFLKQRISHSQFQQSVRYRKAVPSSINRAFKHRYINAAFISSIESSRCRCSDIGIVADGAVYSVFVTPSDNDKRDQESATSNILAKVLGLRGEVSIGDKALKEYLSGHKAIDLSQRWREETSLPFVFARLCFNGYTKEIDSIAKSFARQKIKVPQTILKREAKKRDITPRELRWYLDHIHYKIDHRAKRSLKLFLKRSRELA
jgi:chorismate dehydratase